MSLIKKSTIKISEARLSKVEDNVNEILSLLKTGTVNVDLANCFKTLGIKKNNKKKTPLEDIGETMYNVYYYYNKKQKSQDKEFMYISFSTNSEFKTYIKELGGVWKVWTRGWRFPIASYQDVTTQIKTKFPDWSYEDCIGNVNNQKKRGRSPSPAKSEDWGNESESETEMSE